MVIEGNSPGTFYSGLADEDESLPFVLGLDLQDTSLLVGGNIEYHASE